MSLPGGAGVVTLDLDERDAAVNAEFALDDLRDLAPAVGRVRRLLDLDADPVAVDVALGADPTLGPLVVAQPGLRVAGSVDPAETLARSIIGQQVSLAGARTVTGRIVRELGTPLTPARGAITHLFPSPEQLAGASPEQLPLPASRAGTLQRAARALVDGDLVIDLGTDRHAAHDALLTVKGIGPWTAQLVVMRGLGDPDVFLTSDLVARRALDRAGLVAADSDRWRPWRAYAMHHLWSTMMKEF
jgi:AraC family transcriptional regulator of adaptative response / DNA-3-methyladenine glycosylase II